MVFVSTRKTCYSWSTRTLLIFFISSKEKYFSHDIDFGFKSLLAFSKLETLCATNSKNSKYADITSRVMNRPMVTLVLVLFDIDWMHSEADNYPRSLTTFTHYHLNNTNNKYHRCPLHSNLQGIRHQEEAENYRQLKSFTFQY